MNILISLTVSFKFILIELLFLLCTVYESENESDNDPIEGDDSLRDIEFDSPAQQERRSTQKKNWITPRLCAALDKAKVKKRRLKK